MRKALLTCLAGLVVSGVVAGCGSAEDTFTIGAIYPVSGGQGPGGVEEARGAALAVELANEQGGARGREVRLELVDVDRGGAAPEAIERFRRAGAQVVLGTYGSTISAPAAAAAQREGIILWETGAVGEVDPATGGGDTFFRLAPMGAGLGRSAVAFVREQLGPRLGPSDAAPLRYAVAYVDDAYGRAVGLGAVDEVRESGQVLAGTFPYDVRNLDAREVVVAIAAVRPDVLFVSAYLDDGIALRRATIAAGLSLRASIGTSSSYCMPAFAAALGPGAVGLFASDKPDAAQVRPDALVPQARDELAWARQRYQREQGEEMSPAALSGFANTWALVGHVLPAAPGLRARQIAATARSLKLGPGGLPNGAGIDLAAPGQADAGENRAAVSVIWQWVGERTQAVVWPPAFANHPLEAIPILP